MMPLHPRRDIHKHPYSIDSSEYTMTTLLTNQWSQTPEKVNKRKYLSDFPYKEGIHLTSM